jgi:hypothetical protein
MKEFDLPEIKLSYKQKLILDVLTDEFHGSAFGPEMLADTDNTDLKQLTINEITWHMLRLRESNLVESSKQTYRGRVLNKYTITPVVALNAIKIK